MCLFMEIKSFSHLISFVFLLKLKIRLLHADSIRLQIFTHRLHGTFPFCAENILDARITMQRYFYERTFSHMKNWYRFIPLSYNVVQRYQPFPQNIVLLNNKHIYFLSVWTHLFKTATVQCVANKKINCCVWRNF